MVLLLLSKYLPRRIAVVGESQRSSAQTVKHAEDGQAGANGMAGLHGDQAGDLSGGVGRHQFCNRNNDVIISI